MKKTLILGGGTGGLVAANLLKETMGSSMQVTLVDREPNHYFGSSFPLLMKTSTLHYFVTTNNARLLGKSCFRKVLV